MEEEEKGGTWRGGERREVERERRWEVNGRD